MEDTALLMWAITAGGGLLLFLLWYRSGGAGKSPDDPPDEVIAQQRPGGETHLPQSVVIAHGSLALAGLLLWFLFAPNRNDPDYSPAPWLALFMLVTVAVLGLTMYRRWSADRRALRTGDLDHTPAEQRLPAALVWMHGAAAAVTILLVFLVALDT